MPALLRCLLCLALSCLPLLAADGVLTPEHVAKLRYVASVSIAPDGQHIAYVLSVPRKLFEEDDGPAWSELHVVDRAGRSRPFVAGEVSVSRVSWTRDGKSIAFLLKRDGDETRSLYSIPVDGGEARQLFAHKTDVGAYDLNPVNDLLAFVAEAPVPEKEEKLEEAGFDQKVFEEDWRPEKVWTVDLSDPEGEAQEVELAGSAHALRWRPQGDRLAVTTAPTPFVDDGFMNQQIVVIDPSNGETFGGYRPPGKLGPFRWSPDGKRLGLITSADRSDPSAGRLAVVDLATGASRALLPDLEAHVTGLAWRNENELIYLADEGTHTRIGSVEADGAQPAVSVAADAGLVFGGLSLADNGSAAVVLESANHPPEAALVEGPGVRPERLTDSNPWLGEIRLARQETVRFRARDGLRLEGVLVRPLDEQPGRRYPLILYVHGGPESHEADGWVTSYSRPGQVAAARGFAVFYPNYRASTGRGVEFSKLDHGDFAGKEFDDLVDAADYLAKTGLVDRAKVGVTGGSYGGYATAWAATALSEHFAAGVMFVGISDQISKTGTTDIPTEIFEVHHRKRMWDDWRFFLERSPVYHVEKSRTPLLILHGEKDTRVPTFQSLELYRLLKLRGKAPVRLVLYPNEGHGNRRAAARYDYNLRLLRWMQHYLAGPGGDPPPYAPDYSEVEPAPEPPEDP